MRRSITDSGGRRTAERRKADVRDDTGTPAGNYRGECNQIQKEMDAVAQKTQKAEAIVDRCMSRVNSIVGKANTGNAGKTVDNLTAKLKRQQEAVDQQGFKIDNLRRKLLDLQSGNARNATIANLEAQLKAAEKEFAAVDKQMRPLLDKLS